MRIVRAAYQNERFYAILEAERVIRLTGTPYAGGNMRWRTSG